MENQRIFTMSFGSVYKLYINKAERKGRTKEEVNQIIFWLFGYNSSTLAKILEDETNFKDFLNDAPQLNPLREKITGVVCGIRVENIEDPLMKQIRYLDKLIDELAKGKKMEKILRT